MFITNNLDSFHLWWQKIFLSNIKKSQDCRNKGQSSKKKTKKGLVKIPQKDAFKVNLLVKGAFGTLNVSWTVSYEIILVLLSVCPSVHRPPFTKFSQDWIISFL